MFNKELTIELSDLSKLEFTDNELRQMAKDMTDIIALMDKVRDFDVSNIHKTSESTSYDMLRNDSFKESYPTEKILENAKTDGFAVPKVV